MSGEYRAVTNGVEVTVRTYFLEDQSDPDEGRWVWAYQVRIANLGRETVQLLRRTWRITDAHGRMQIVQGAGVVGEQPVLEPGDAFEYTSGTPLETSSGFMVGTYHMIVTASAQELDVAIPAFSLDCPGQRTHLH
jgi:ApaG protein